MKRFNVFSTVLLVLTLLLPGLAAPLAPQAPAFFYTHANFEPARLVLGQSVFNSRTPAGGPGGMNSPLSVAVDPVSGKVFVADLNNHRVLRFASGAALVNGAAADGVLGQPDQATTTAATTQSGMNYPSAVAFDSTGRLWVADMANNRVLRFDNAALKTPGANADGVLGQPDFTSAAQGTTPDHLFAPFGVAADSGGRLWVADYYNNRVVRFDDAAGSPPGDNADGVLGQPNYTSGGWNTTQNGMWSPMGVSVDASGSLWVADMGNDRVLRFDNAASKAPGALADGVLGQTNFTSRGSGTSAGQFWAPAGLAVDDDGRLWVCDWGNGRLLRFDGVAAKAPGAAADGVLGQPGFTSNQPNNGGISAQTMAGPRSVFHDRVADRLWVADDFNHRVTAFSRSRLLVLNAAAPNSVVANGSAATWLETGTDFAWVTVGGSRDTTLTIANRSPSSISLTGSPLVQLGGSHPGDFSVVSSPAAIIPSGGSTSVTIRFTPTASGLRTAKVTIANSTTTDNPYAFMLQGYGARPADPENADLVLGQADFTSGSPGAETGLTGPTDVAVDPLSGKVFAVDGPNKRVLRYAGFLALANGVPPEAVLGKPDFTTTTCSVSASCLVKPYGLVLDAAGRLWVADSGANRVLRFDGAASLDSGAPAAAVLGQSTFTGTTAAAGATGMSDPVSVAVDGAGRLWVVDRNNNRVLRFNGAAGKPNGGAADGVLGALDFNPPLCGAIPGGICAPYSAALGPGGVLWVMDNRGYLLRFDDAASLSDGSPPSGSLGRPGPSELKCGGGPNQFCSGGVTAGADGRVWVADLYGNRVLRFDGAAAKPDNAPADGVVGQPHFYSYAANLDGRSSRTLSGPRGVFFDNFTGALWVADTSNHRLLAYTDPQIQLSGSSGGPPVLITNGDVSPAVEDGTDFGSVPNGGMVDHTFTVANPGTSRLYLTGSPLVQMMGGNPGEFTVVLPPENSVAPGGQTTFKIRFSPGSPGLRQTEVTITSSDVASSPFGFVIQGTGQDLAAPTVQIDSAPPALSNSRTAEFAFSGSDTWRPAESPAGRYAAPGPGLTFQCQLTTPAPFGCTSPAVYTGLADGSYTFQVRSKDAAGNTSAWVQHSFTVDATAPAAPLVTSPANGSVIVGNRRPPFTGTAEPGATVSVWGPIAGARAPAAPWCTALVNGSGQWSCQGTLDLQLGPVVMYAAAYDAADNTSPITSVSFSIRSAVYLPVARK